MKVAIIVSSKDQAGMNIKNNLLKSKKWTRTGLFDSYHYYNCKDMWLFTVQKESIYNEDVDELIEEEIKQELDLVIFATKHESKSKIPSLSVHTQGNWGKAEFGGKDRTLAVAPANILKTAFIKLQHNATRLDYDIIQECTHHGPNITRPCFFIEIGSDKEHWKNEKAGKVIAETIFDLLEGKILKDRVAIGIGGLHTTPIFKKVIEREDIAFGHVCPKYMLDELDKEMLQEAIEKTKEKVDFIALDWKGMKDKDRIILMLEEMGLKYEKFKF